jgi:hypothetical protein
MKRCHNVETGGENHDIQVHIPPTLSDSTVARKFDNRVAYQFDIVPV